MNRLKNLTNWAGRLFGYSMQSSWSNKHQASFRKNKELIYRGVFPERYIELRSLTPGNRILDVGSADGTFSLALSEKKESVFGVELTKARFDTAVDLKKHLHEQTKRYDNCTFHHGRIEDHPELLEKVDAVTFIRVAYYLPMDLVLNQIRSHGKIAHLLLCGNRAREERAKQSKPWGRARHSFKLATEKGMIDLMRAHEIHDFKVVRMRSTGDPVLIATL
ncbi:MAG: class I SAM-dependent methyltransferase [Wenzhouxiangella sp.]|nr:class I SAM-dependent methyltransferase [Wenzhouxiangella sp.]